MLQLRDMEYGKQYSLEYFRGTFVYLLQTLFHLSVPEEQFRSLNLCSFFFTSFLIYSLFI